MKKRNLTQRVTSHPITKKIKENPKQAVKYGLRLKICETLITGIIFGASTALMNNYTHQEKPSQNIYQKSPIIRDDSKDILGNYIETELKLKENEYS